VSDQDLDMIDEIAGALVEPIGDQALLPTWKVLRDLVKGMDVIVSGEGGDELWGLPRRWPEHTAIEASKLTMAVVRQHVERISCVNSPLRLTLLRDVMSARDVEYAPAELFASWVDESPYQTAMKRLQHVQLRTWLVDNVLAKDLQVAHAFGLDARFPLVSPDLMARVMALPPKAHAQLVSGKTALRSFLGSDAPAEVLSRPKHKFLVPFGEWIVRSELAAERISETLLGRAAICPSFLDPTAVENLLSGLRRGDQAMSRPLWLLLMIELWLRHLRSEFERRR
jgi:asparagine synthase (glutamine-hydrolysing)